MFPGMPVQGNKQERKLLKLFKSLDDGDKESLLSFAEFLKSRQETPASEGSGVSAKELASKPLDMARPENESVIKAIKRLTATYPMVDKEGILHPISGLMTAHIMQGRKAPDVIDELEALFLKEYEKLKGA